MSNLIADIPAGAQVIRRVSDDGKRTSWWVSYVVPEQLGVKSPQGGRIRLAFQVSDREELEALFRDRTPKPDLTMSVSQWRQWGIINAGKKSELANTSEHPFHALVSSFKREAKTQPWLRDPEVLGLTVSAMLKGREVSEGELRSTNWWQSRSDAEREWVRLQAGDPRTAQDRIAQARRQVRDEVRRWLGPTHGAWSDRQVDSWAQRLASEGDRAVLELNEELRSLRLAAFPEWTNENTTYESIAGITQGLVQQTWGQTLDEKDRLFQRLVGMADHDAALRRLREEGLDRGVTQVLRDFAGGAMNALGGQQRRAV